MYKELFKGMDSVTFIDDEKNALNESPRIYHFKNLDIQLSSCLKKKKAELAEYITFLSDPKTIVKVLPFTSLIIVTVNGKELFKINSEHYLYFCNDIIPVDMAEAFTKFSINKLISACQKKNIDVVLEYK